MAMKLTTANIDIVERQMLDNLDTWEDEAERAKMLLTYIAGIHDMANAVRRAIEELGGR